MRQQATTGAIAERSIAEVSAAITGPAGIGITTSALGAFCIILRTRSRWQAAADVAHRHHAAMNSRGWLPRRGEGRVDAVDLRP